MSTITALVGSDGITTANSMTKINTNFSNLNTDKIETSVLDTDTTLAANSDSKVATQKAVKTYVDAGGNVNASTTTKGIVEEATQAEQDAGTAAGGTGARLFVNPSTFATTVNPILTDITSLETNEIYGQALGPTYAKTFHSFKIPMIGTSAAAVVGAWVSSSTETIFTYGESCKMEGTGAERVSHSAIGGPFGQAGSGEYRVRFADANIIVMDYWAILPTSSVDTMIGFCDAASSLTITYNQTAQEALCFTTNNGSLYGHVCTGAAATTTAISGVTVSTPHNYRIVADLGADSVGFYVDGVLKLTVATNFPTSTQFVQMIMGRSATGDTFVSNPNFAVEVRP